MQGRSLGVLTHEAIIDAEWDRVIVPLLKLKYPSATPDELKTAHAYAYGGAAAPDMGYYPFGSHLFTNLVHYVRSGDMVDALIKDAGNLNAFAFAVGFLSHYDADNYGHPLATNRSVPLVYPRMKSKFGDDVTYGDNKISHLRMEFGFDVLQTAKGNYASKAYHDFIGFKVDTALLAQAFFETYGLDIDNVFNNHLSFSVEIFRFMVASVFPVITRTAWATKGKKAFEKDKTITTKKFRYKMRIRQYNKEYGKGYKRPGFFPEVLSFFIRVIPKVGPIRALHFKTPTPQAEKYFDESFDTILLHYDASLLLVKHGYKFTLEDEDFDTGKPTGLCEYNLANDTYNTWLFRLQRDKFKNVTTGIQKNIVSFYVNITPPKQTRHAEKCMALYHAFDAIKNIHVITHE